MKRLFWTLAFACSAAGACRCSSDIPVCPDGGVRCGTTVDVLVDVATDRSSVVVRPDVRDVPWPLPPWSAGGWHLPWRVNSHTPPPACGPGQPLPVFFHNAAASGFCATAGWITTGAYGTRSAYDFLGRSSVLSTSDGGGINIGCAGASLVAGITDDASATTAFFRFSDPWAVGEPLWSAPLVRPIAAGARVHGGIGEVVASDQLLAFTLFDQFDRSTLWVGGPRGENIHQLDLAQNVLLGRRVERLQADGPHITMMAEGDIVLYTRGLDGSDAIENLTADAPGQWDSWISGRYVVWIDQRDQAAGDPTLMNNPEVYLYDLTTRERRRITHDLDDRPAIQAQPMVYGDWIVWVDQRHAPRPNLEDALAPKEVYGYQISSSREVALIPGSLLLASPVLTAQGLYYACANLRPTRSEGTYLVPSASLPR